MNEGGMGFVHMWVHDGSHATYHDHGQCRPKVLSSTRRSFDNHVETQHSRHNQEPSRKKDAKGDERARMTSCEITSQRPRPIEIYTSIKT